MIRYCILWLAFFTTGVCAQDTTKAVALSHYVFEKFTKGRVLLRSGMVSEQVLNYNILTGEMIFDAGGKYLAIAEPQNVDTIYINNRRFVPAGSKFYEVLTHTRAPLLLEFTNTIQEQGKSLGYGTASNTTAAAPLKALINSGGAYDLKLPDNFIVKPGFNYWILKEGRYWKANNAQQFAKIFPDKKRRIATLIKELKTDFSKREAVIELVQQLQPPEEAFQHKL